MNIAPRFLTSTPLQDGQRVSIGDETFIAKKTDAGFELINPVKTLPTRPGLYAPNKSGRTSPRSSRFLLLNTSGDWFWLDFTSVLQTTFSNAEHYGMLETANDTVGRYADTITPVFIGKESI